MTAPRGKNLLDLSIKVSGGGKFLLATVTPKGCWKVWERPVPWGWESISGLGCGQQQTAQGDAHPCEFLCKNHLLVVAVRALLALGWVAWWWLGLSLGVPPSPVAGCSSWWPCCHCHSTCHVFLGFWSVSGIPEIPL